MYRAGNDGHMIVRLFMGLRGWLSRQPGLSFVTYDPVVVLRSTRVRAWYAHRCQKNTYKSNYWRFEDWLEHEHNTNCGLSSYKALTFASWSVQNNLSHAESIYLRPFISKSLCRSKLRSTKQAFTTWAPLGLFLGKCICIYTLYLLLINKMLFTITHPFN